MSKQRYEVSICFTDRGGTKRYVNRVATLWFDGQRGNIEIPPGVALYGQEGVFINVDLPRDQREGGPPGGGYGRGASGRTGRGGPPDDPDNLPF